MLKLNKKTKNWTIAILFTASLIWLEAIVGKWFVGLFGLEITLLEAIVIAIIANFAVGFAKVKK